MTAWSIQTDGPKTPSQLSLAQSGQGQCHTSPELHKCSPESQQAWCNAWWLKEDAAVSCVDGWPKTREEGGYLLDRWHQLRNRFSAPDPLTLLTERKAENSRRRWNFYSRGTRAQRKSRFRYRNAKLCFLQILRTNTKSESPVWRQ